MASSSRDSVPHDPIYSGDLSIMAIDPMRRPKYRVEYRHQDDDWRDSLHGVIEHGSDAVCLAFEMRQRPMVWGMVRVVDAATGAVMPFVAE